MSWPFRVGPISASSLPAPQAAFPKCVHLTGRTESKALPNNAPDEVRDDEAARPSQMISGCWPDRDRGLMQKRRRKATSTKAVEKTVWSKDGWTVVSGDLQRGRGRPGKVVPLFSVVAEKLPFGCLDDVKKELKALNIKLFGVYAAHDSMGTPRYLGRGAIFTRLKSHLKAHRRELVYFSFFVVKEKTHEREVETLAIRAAGDTLQFNSRKKRTGIAPGNVRDYEAGTRFFERQQKRGRKMKKRAG
jgi:hypothetical protein